MALRPAPLAAGSRRAALRRRLLAWWYAGHRDLPWRFPQRGAEPYRVWLAEVMLQQTRVETVIGYYRRFVERWPTLDTLAGARDEDVFAAWSGLGYYARCRNLLAAARLALARHGGLPASVEALRALPGFGPYTAGAVASIAFAIPAAAVDGNVARVLARLFALRDDPAGRRHQQRLWALARALVGEAAPGARARPREGIASPGDWNQALMELGATVCGRTPACGACPVKVLCEARRRGLTRTIPAPRRRPRRTRLVLACAVIEQEGRVLLERRPAGGLFGAMLAFPFAEVGGDEGAPPALRRALLARGLPIRPLREVAVVERTLTHRDLVIRAFACDRAGGRQVPPGRGLRWEALQELERIGLPSAMMAVAAALPGVPRRRARAGTPGARRESCAGDTTPLAFSADLV